MSWLTAQAPAHTHNVMYSLMIDFMKPGPGLQSSIIIDDEGALEFLC
jgi:hypothetical protein